jgi:hypothetical protein
MHENYTNFSLSIPQKLEICQIIAAIEDNDTTLAKERAVYLIEKAKENAKIADRHKSLLRDYSIDQILDAAASALSVKAA